MPLSFSCVACGRPYTVDDALAGRRARCKACGTEMRIPARSAPEPDLYGLDEAEPVPQPSADRFAADDPEAVVPRRSGGLPRAKTARGRDRGEDGSGIRKVLFYVIGFGLFAFVLPFFGLVLKPRGAHQGLDPKMQQEIGMGIAILGGILLAISYAFGGAMSGLRATLGERRAAAIGRWTRRGVWGAIGLFLFLLIFLPIFSAVVRRMAPARRAAVPAGPGPQAPGLRPPNAPGFPPDVAANPGPALAGPVADRPEPGPPAGGNGPAPGQPGPPGAGRPPFPGPGPFVGGPPGPASEAAAPVRQVLSNGRIGPARTPTGEPRRGLAFQVDYQAQGPVSEAGRQRYMWVIETAGRPVRLPAPSRPRAQGTFRTTIGQLRPEDGPFRIHLEALSVGPGGRRESVVSNTVPLEWSE